MVPGRVIFTGKTKKGFDILVRYPKPEDLQRMRDYINTLSSEKTFILFQGEQVTLDEEKEYLESQLKKIEENKSVNLLTFNEEKLIAISDLGMRNKAERHIGYFGISVAKEFRGKGIGGLLMGLVIKEAEKNIKGLKIIELSVFGDNTIAQSMYKKFGFQEFGTLPRGILHAGIPVDHIYMYKKVS